MKDNPLTIVQMDDKGPSTFTSDNLETRLKESEARYERIWLNHPERFDPSRNALGRLRIELTTQLIEDHFELKDLQVVDIGCGNGTLSKILADRGAKVLATDIASNALKLVPDELSKEQQHLPKTSLKDDQYDLCLCTEVIAELDHRDFRLAIAELSRIIKPEGKAVISAPIDIYSEDALIRFRKLAETEFKILNWQPSYHSLYLKKLHFIKAPKNFFNAWRDKNKREKGIKERRGLRQWWFKINSIAIPALFWAPVQVILSPLIYFFEQNRTMIVIFEKICYLFQNDRGISHVIFVGKRRPLLEEREMPPIPDRPPFRKEVLWE